MAEEAQPSGGDQLKALIASLSQGLGPAKPFNKAAATPQDASTIKLYEDLKKVISNLDDTIKENGQLVKSITELKKALSSREKTSKPSIRELGGRSSNDALAKLASTTQKTSIIENRFYKAGLKKGSIFTHDVHIVKELEKLNETFSEVRDCLCGDKKEKVEKKLILPEDSSPISSPKETLARTASSSQDEEESLKRRFEELYVLKRYQQIMGNISKTAAQVQISLMGFTAFNKITEDLVQKEREFTQGIRQAAYQTMGVTKENRTLQHTLTEIGETTKITGFNRSESQKAYLNNFKKGIKDQKTALKLSTTQLHTEKMIGVEAGTLSESFSNMSLQMGFSTSQMDSLSRGIRQVALDTGVTGDNLASSVKNSEQFMKNLRNSAQLTVEGGKSIMGLMTSAEKFGVQEGYQDLLGTMSQGLTGFANASSQTKALLGQIGAATGKVNEMMSGQLASDPKAIVQGIDSVLRTVSGGMVDLNTDLSKLDSDTKMRLDAASRAAYGRGIGELQLMGKAGQESMKTLSDRLMETQRKILDKSSTAKEKEMAMEERARLKTGASLDALSQLSQNASKAGGDFNKALQDFRGSPEWDKISENLNAIGINTTDGKKMTRELLQSSISSVNEGLKKAKKKGLDISTKDIEKAISGDAATFREIEEKISAGNQELGTAQLSQTDVLTEMNHTLTQLNDTLRGRIQGFLGNLLDSTLGKFVYFTSAAAGGMLDVGHSVFDTFLQMKQAGIINDAIMKGMGDKAKLIYQDIFKGNLELSKGLKVTLTELFGPEVVASAGAALRTVAIGATAIIAVAGAIYGSISAGEKAAELFDKQMEDVTMAEYYAAKGAGAVTGALNFLTLGIFDSFLGSTGIVTKWLAQFNKMIPLLSFTYAVLDVIAGAIWGIVLSVKDVFVGAFEMIYMILEPFGILISGIGEAIGIVLGPLFGFTAGLEETGSLFKIFADIFGVFGKVLRGIMQVIGFIIGGLLKIFVGILVPLIKAVAYFLSIFTNAIGYVFNTIFEGVLGIVQFFQGLFTLDFSKMGQGLWNVFSTLALGIPNLIWRIIKGIPSFIVDGLVGIGSAILNSVVSAFTSVGSWIAGFFTELPSNIYSMLYSAASAVGLGWLVESIGGKPKDKKAEEGFKGMSELAKEGTTKGSIYTHDTHLERQMIALNSMLAFSSIGNSAASSITSALGGFFGKKKAVSTGSEKSGGLFTGITDKYEEFKKSFFDSSFFEGISSRYKGFTDTISKSFSDNLAEPTKSFFKPLTKGFTKAREEGKGFFESAKRGMKGQYMSTTKGGLLKEGSTLGNLKESALEKYDWAKEGLLGSKEGEKVKKGLLQKAKDGLLGEKDGEKVKKGILTKVKDGILGEKIGAEEFGPPKPGMLDQAKNKAKGFYEKGKEKLLGAKQGEEFGPPKPGLLDQAKNKAKGFYEKGKEKLGFGKKEGDALEGAASGNKIGVMENAKVGLKNLAEGLKALAGRDVLFGALNLIPASVGLVSMIAGSAGAYLISKIDGEALKTGLTGIADGLKSMASAKVLLGAMALIPAALGFTLLLPGLAGMALLGVVGPLAQAGLSALASGLSSFGSAAMNPMFWVGLGALALFNIALIPLTFALSLLSPLVESFGKAVKSAFEGIATVVDSVLGGLTTFISALSLDRAAGIIAVAGALGILSLSLIAFGAATTGVGFMSFFGGNGILDKVMLLSAAGQNLMMTATAMNMLSTSVKSLDEGLESFLAKSDKIDQFSSAITKLALSSALASIAMPKQSVVANTASENMQNSVQREIVSSEPINKIESSELGSLASEGKTQTEQLVEAVALLQQIADSLSGKESTGTGLQPGGNTSTISNPSKPVNNYSWNTGKQSQLSGRGLRKS